MLSDLFSLALLLIVAGIGVVAAIRLGMWMSAVFASLIGEKRDITTTAEILMMQ
jgi:hypothetical protein